MIQVYVWKKIPEELEIIDRLIQAAFSKKITYQLTELQDNPTPEIPTDGSLLLCFGIRSYNIISFKTSTAIKLPVPHKLIDIPINQFIRQEAWNILQGLQGKIPTLQDKTLELKPEDVAKNLQQQYQSIDSSTYWIGTTTLGKKVLISKQPITTIPHDYYLTPDELFALKLSFDLLGLKSVTLTKGNKDD